MKLSTLIAELSVVIGAGYLLGYKAGKLQGQVESFSAFAEMIREAKEEVMSGFKQLLMQSGYTDLLCLVKAEE